MVKELNNLFITTENVIGFPKLLKFVRVNKFYIPNGNPLLGSSYQTLIKLIYSI